MNNTNKDKKILFTDLDETLLTSKKEVSPKTRQTIAKILERGHFVCFCSGRPVESVIMVATELGYPMGTKNVFYGGSNGGTVIDSESGEEIYAIKIPKKVCDIVEEGADRFQVHCHTYTRKEIASRAQTKELSAYQTAVQLPTLLVKHLSDVPEDPYKCLCIAWYDHERLERLQKYLEERSEGLFKTVFSNDALLECIPIQSGKHIAVERLSQYLGVPIENTMACGDEGNDASMIELAGLGVAMINGTEIPKAVADVITEKDNNHDGLVPYLEKFFF